MVLDDFYKKFPTQKAAINYFVEIRYHGALVCPFCGKTQNIYQDHNNWPKKIRTTCCKNSFSMFRDTIFFKSKINIRDWFLAIYMFLNDKNGKASLELSRYIKVSDKTALRMLRKIREAMGNVDMRKTFEKIVEVDETYIGGNPKYMHKNKKYNYSDDFIIEKKHLKKGRGTKKIPVVGVKNRETSEVYAKVMLPNEKGTKLSGEQLDSVISHVCKENTTVITDDFKGYNYLDKTNNFIHYTVNHSEGQYSTGDNIHVNGLENFWGQLKRSINGTYHKVTCKYLQNYVDEFSFRFNNRKNENILDTLLNQTILKKDIPKEAA